jgi:hypothetical protein
VFRRAGREKPPKDLAALSAVSGVPVERAPRDWVDDLPDSERDEIIEKVATQVVSRRMATPAILFLEMHKPVSFIASQSLVVLSPFTAPFVGMDNVQVASKLLEKRENVEKLIQRIEELSAEQEAGDRASKKAARAARQNSPQRHQRPH